MASRLLNQSHGSGSTSEVLHADGRQLGICARTSCGGRDSDVWRRVRGVEFPGRAGLRRRGSLQRPGRPGFCPQREPPFSDQWFWGTQSWVSKPLSAELSPGASRPLNVGGRLPRLPGGWELRGGAQGSQNQAPVPLEDPGMNAEGVVRVRPLLPDPLPSPPGRTLRAAGAEVFWQLLGGQVPA